LSARGRRVSGLSVRRGEIPIHLDFPGPDGGGGAPSHSPARPWARVRTAVGDRAGRDTKILRLVSALSYSSMVESELNRYRMGDDPTRRDAPPQARPHAHAQRFQRRTRLQYFKEPSCEFGLAPRHVDVQADRFSLLGAAASAERSERAASTPARPARHIASCIVFAAALFAWRSLAVLIIAHPFAEAALVVVVAIGTLLSLTQVASCGSLHAEDARGCCAGTRGGRGRRRARSCLRHGLDPGCCFRSRQLARG
jgi:hypothetical protein